MARFLIVGCVAGTWLAAPLALAQPVMLEEPSAAVKTCVTKNAADVERAFDFLNEGADFLAQKVCAVEVAQQVETWSDEQTCKERQAFADHMKEACDDRKAPSTPSGEKQSFDDMMCDNQRIFGVDYTGGTSISWRGLMDTPTVSALAAQTLLKLRTERLRAKP